MAPSPPGKPAAFEFQDTVVARPPPKPSPVGRPREGAGQSSAAKPAAPAPSAQPSPSTIGPFGDVIRLVAERRPELIDVVLQMDRAAKQKVEAGLREEAREQRREMAIVLERIGQLLATEAENMTRLGQLTDGAQAQGERAIHEATVVAEKYKILLERASAERDSLARQLVEARAHAAEDAKQQAQACVDLQRTVARERHALAEQGERTQNEAEKLRARIAELEGQLRDAMQCNERLLERVRKVEVRIEQDVIPLREKLEAAQARAYTLSTQLATARKELGTLKLLTPPGGK